MAGKICNTHLDQVNNLTAELCDYVKPFQCSVQINLSLQTKCITTPALKDLGKIRFKQMQLNNQSENRVKLKQTGCKFLLAVEERFLINRLQF